MKKLEFRDASIILTFQRGLANFYALCIISKEYNKCISRYMFERMKSVLLRYSLTS